MGQSFYNLNFYGAACVGCTCMVATLGLGLIPFRHHVRTKRGIPGFWLRDVLTVVLCLPCSWVRVSRGSYPARRPTSVAPKAARLCVLLPQVQLAAEVGPPPTAGAPPAPDEMER